LGRLSRGCRPDQGGRQQQHNGTCLRNAPAAHGDGPPKARRAASAPIGRKRASRRLSLRQQMRARAAPGLRYVQRGAAESNTPPRHSD
ncbi:MAG: hypothetical protein ACE5HE_07350, partial [Phycisphaerae bacterium]